MTHPIILLPGLTCHQGYWDLVAADLARDFQIHAFDWRGHGEAAHASTYHFPDYVADLDAFIAHHGCLNPVLVGHSMGGYVALLRATRPGIAAVVALDVKTAASAEELEGARRAAAKPQPRVASLAELAVRLGATMSDGNASDELILALTRQGAVENEDGTWSLRYDRAVLAIDPVDPFAFAPDVQAPCVVAHGERSAMMTAAQASALAAAIPNAHAETIPDAGHHVLIDQPIAVADLVRRWVTTLSMPRPAAPPSAQSPH